MALPALVGFTHALADAGLDIGTDRTAAFLTAVSEVDVANPDQLYWAGRVTLCREPDEIAGYDAVFARWFYGERPSHGHVRRSTPRVATVTPETSGADTDGENDSTVVRQIGASEAEVLRNRDMSGLDAAEREHLAELFALLRPTPPTRRSLRRKPSRRGALDQRRTVRAMFGTGGEPVRLARRSRSHRPRRVVLLVDVSGSMEPYSDALLRFAHAVARRTPGNVEAFTLGTRLTRVSRQLRQRDPARALPAAANAVPDYAGGTRLGETLRVFLDRWGQRGLARSAIVVLFSDGWERGDPALLGEQVARLRRLAHTVLWVNPHAGRDGYAPIQSGIAAALPHIDRLLAGHSLATLEELLGAMRDARRT
ncbi:vWA domain-containing protein [Haloechinothrix halophila]|uniref:vWA domain-containing protein n=1 Tax=Haloechinothrix halophila TaxID=1069073 RepID=UPI0004100287|nr:VWA domain-containing protein [Haloechinothrix halophila]